MNSDLMPKNNYATDDDMVYGAHYVTLASDVLSYENNTGKFVLSHVTPNNAGDAFDKTLPKNNTGNVINDDNLGVANITTSNYVYITVPKHYFYITKLEIVTNVVACGKGGIGSCGPKIIITRKEYHKGDKFVVVNVGGNIDDIQVVGVVS